MTDRAMPQQPVILISGGNIGIGRATALRFAGAGAQIVIAARNADTARETLDLVSQAGGQGQFVPCDVRDEAQCDQAVAASVGRYGRLDVLVNNAGIIVRNRTVAQTTTEQWQAMLDVNVSGAFYLSRAALPHLAVTRGNIVNVSSYAGLVGFPGSAAYCAAKGALVQLTRAMALDHATEGIRVNCVCPGSVRTPMIEKAWQQHGQGAAELWSEKHPLGRIAEAEEVAEAIYWLASDGASFVTGAALPVDGGITAG
ncbi:MAG: SDR family oxidoreductase [Anaerolineae bacterium]|nr:SDR family oxidoreductase [Anaerolineae bacterium]